MHGLHFLTGSIPSGSVIQGFYQPSLVLLSIVLASIAAYTALSQLTLISAQRTRAGRITWYALGAITLGTGVWSMHFTGMLAYQLPVTIEYNVPITLLSMVPAGGAGLVMLHLIHHEQPSLRQLLTAGVLMGLGVGGMHYIGMAAMVVEARMLYRPGLFILSVLVAVVLAIAALGSRYWLKRYLHLPQAAQLAAALIMGLAVSGMHYTGMAATIYLPGPMMGLPGPTFSEGPLAAMAVMVGAFIVTLATASTLALQRLQSAENLAQASENRAETLAHRLKTMTDRVPGVVYQFEQLPDGRYRFPYASEAIEDVYRVKPEEVETTADPVIERIHPDDFPAVLASVESSAENLTPWNSQYRVQFENGDVRWLLGNAMPERTADGGTLWNGFIMDVTDQMDRERKIHHLSHFDQLTDLPNRQSLRLFLEQALEENNRSGWITGLIQIELDGFLRFRDAEGIAAADAKLRRVASVLGERRREGDMAARIGDSEFALVWTQLGRSLRDATMLVEKRLEKLRDYIAFTLDHPLYSNTVSAGVSLIRDPALDADTALHQVAQALNHARTNGPGGLAYFDAETQAALNKRLTLERELRQALLHDELRLFLQTQVNPDGEAIGAEALIRWEHPERGLLTPYHFIELAEETGLILEIGEWVLEQACCMLSRWSEHPTLRDWPLSINVSARQFAQQDFVQSVRYHIDRAGIEASRLKIEITESLALDNVEHTLQTIEALAAMGIRFSMDDFGTGYSSLSYLSRLPFREVKIDKSFIQSESGSSASRDWMIVQSIINLTRSIGLTVVAEGVETLEQRDRLREAGCMIYQGFCFSRPMPESALADSLAEDDSNRVSDSPVQRRY